ncbi:SAVED domain-containing protein [Bordetella genomosp. 12]|uniref:SMODS-associated and fused to various effectors domain-containing protein n=1 Tax=Bordetella genomosp. 12 TaxID=463035 RepID=A0A261VC13_9BORD|nr:SAVED domain-containing protein [Bordetella genomosp. 12]OZI71686.1 hypothetical protein CAL22_17975 [Bordetella genomosp. 12]
MNSKSLIEKLVDFYVRPRHISVQIFRASISLLGALAVGGGVSIAYKNMDSSQEFTLSWGDGPGAVAFWGLFSIASVATLVSLFMARRRSEFELDELRVSRVLAVELRGLVDTADSPLVKAIPAKIVGRRESCLVDVRRLVMGPTPNILDALNELVQLRRQIRLMTAGTSREHLTVVAGGVMQVSLLFYAGVLLDDEGRVQLMEWERTTGNWKELDEQDSGERFSISGLTEVEFQCPDIVVAVSASYLADFAGIAQTFPDMPVVQLRLHDPKPNTLLSGTMQEALTRQFTDVMAELANRSVGRVHLILAAPATLCVRFGQAYDPRNMPTLKCYQRERDQTPPYPWNIEIDGNKPARFEQTSQPITQHNLGASNV